MKKQKIIYALTMEDVLNVSKEEKLPFNLKKLPLIEEKVGDYLGNVWQNAIKYALNEVNNK